MLGMTKPPVDLREQVFREANEAKTERQDVRIERQEALLEYTAMMLDVELPEEEDSE